MADVKKNGEIYIEDIFDEEDNVEILSHVPHLYIKGNDKCKYNFIFIFRRLNNINLLMLLY